MKQRLTLFFVLLLLLGSALPALAQGNPAAAWLQSQVRADGGFSDGFSDASGVGPTTEAIYAAVAAGEDGSTWGSDASPLDFLATSAASATGTGTLAKLVLAAQATGQEPASFGGVNLVEKLQGEFDAAAGTFKGTVTDHAYAMLALHAAGAAIPDGATAALAGLQADDGGWSFDGTSQSDTNTTALAIQALVAAGEAADSATITEALAFLETQQNPDGGFPYQAPSDFGTESDANSTAWTIQGLLAGGQNLADWNNPQDFLASLQGEDGAFQWKTEVPGANFLATAQAIPALAGVTFVELPTVAASQPPTLAAPVAAATPTPAAPGALPTAGATMPWAAVAAGGALLALTGVALRRVAR